MLITCQNGLWYIFFTNLDHCYHMYFLNFASSASVCFRSNTSQAPRHGRYWLVPTTTKPLHFLCALFQLISGHFLFFFLLFGSSGWFSFRSFLFVLSFLAIFIPSYFNATQIASWSLKYNGWMKDFETCSIGFEYTWSRIPPFICVASETI